MNGESFAANLESYKVFYYIAKYGSITAAAERMYLTQPTVTKAIHKLEERLGCTLFIRTKRGVRLTPEGQLLWRRVEPACNMLLAGERELRAVKTLTGGTLTIVSTEMSFSTYILPALSLFLESHPEVKVKCKNALNGRMVELLQEGEADLAVIHAPFDSSSVTVIREIDRNYECLVGSQRFRSLAARPRTVQELAEYPFISMPSGSSSREYIESYFRRGGVRFEPDIELTTVELAIQAVSGGFGIGTLPERLISDRIASGEMCRIDLTDPLPPRRVCLISGKNSALSLTARAFVDECLPEARA